MENLCTKCGGGFGEYTAPEARCRCGDTKRRENSRHALAVAEANWLRDSKWEVLDVINGNQGYLWKAPAELGGFFPISQGVAVEVQKKLDQAHKSLSKNVWTNGLTVNTLRDEAHKTEKEMNTQMAEIKLQQHLRI